MNGAIVMHHWTPGTPFIGTRPGDFIFSDETLFTASADRARSLDFECPRGAGVCSLPLQSTSGSRDHPWRWDGDRQSPTITPAISCSRCGWNGHITAGVMTS